MPANTDEEGHQIKLDLSFMEPVASTSTSIENPMELSDTEDLISLHPGEDESFSLPDKTDVQAALEFSDIGDSDAEELLDQLAEAYD